MVLKIKAVNVSLWPKVQRSEHPLPEASRRACVPLGSGLTPAKL